GVLRLQLAVAAGDRHELEFLVGLAVAGRLVDRRPGRGGVAIPVQAQRVVAHEPVIPGREPAARGLDTGLVDHRLRAGRPVVAADLHVAAEHVVVRGAGGHLGGAAVVPVPGEGAAVGVVVGVGVGERPHPGVLHHVVRHREVAGALVEVQRDGAVVVVHVVVLDHAARVGGQVVDAAAVVHDVLGVEDQVVGDGVVLQRSRGGVDGLVVVGAPVGVVLAAARVVDAPAPADVDPVVGQVIHLVVGDRRRGDVGGQDRGDLLVVGAHPAHVVVADRDVLVGHRRAARVVRVRLDTADHDPVGRLVGERVAGDGDGDVAGAQADPASVGVGVLPDAQPDLTQVGERVAAERDVRGRGYLYGSGYLVPVVADGLEELAARAARAQPVGRP